MKKINLILILISFTLAIDAQVKDSIYSLSLDQAINYALKNNLNLSNSQLEIKKAKWKIWETTAIGLPHVNASSEYQQFPDIPTQLMPNFMMPVVVGINGKYFGLHPIKPLPDEGDKIPVQFGSKYNLNWGITISQLIFSGEYIVGLEAAKTFKLVSEQNLEKAQISLKTNVEQAYFLALIAKQSTQILKQNYQNIKTLASNTQKLVEQGVSNQTQADQLKILQLNLKNQISSLKRQEQLSILMLKLQLGMNPSDSLILTDSLENISQNLDLQILANNFELNSNIDYQMMNSQVKLKLLDMRRAESKTLPQVSAYFSYSKKAMLDSFDFLDKDTKWFPTGVIGLKLSIPLFASGQKYSEIKQKKIELIETRNKQKMLADQLNVQYEQAKNDYLNALDNLYSQKQNKKLSEKIFKNTQSQYKEGTASSMDLTQAQNQYLQAESSYYQALMQALKAKTSLEKLLYKTKNNN
jgi:outer membrane protein TolC